MAPGVPEAPSKRRFELAGDHAFLADHQIDGRILMPVRAHSHVYYEHDFF